jgi:hypothetical protein
MSRPIRPEEVVCSGIPDNVIEAFNELIQENIRGKRAVILQEEIIERILSKYYDDPLIARETIYANDWLDIEDLFRDAGWRVVYDKPSSYDSYPATFTFIKP